MEMVRLRAAAHRREGAPAPSFAHHANHHTSDVFDVGGSAGLARFFERRVYTHDESRCHSRVRRPGSFEV